MTISPPAANIIYSGPAPAGDQPVLVLTTVADADTAQRVAATLVEERLAACVNLGAPSLSIYVWQGAVQRETELALTIKTLGARVDALARRLVQLHPYSVPELLVLNVTGGSAAYLAWMADNVQGG
ncbi:MAG: divalent-cation tolerance protein CutA [Castellaniella sp.]